MFIRNSLSVQKVNHNFEKQEGSITNRQSISNYISLNNDLNFNLRSKKELFNYLSREGLKTQRLKDYERIKEKNEL
jgi:hypothetical protein